MPPPQVSQRWGSTVAPPLSGGSGGNRPAMKRGSKHRNIDSKVKKVLAAFVSMKSGYGAQRTKNKNCIYILNHIPNASPPRQRSSALALDALYL